MIDMVLSDRIDDLLLFSTDDRMIVDNSDLDNRDTPDGINGFIVQDDN